MPSKILAIVLLVVGEALSVYSEMIAANNHAGGAPVFWKNYGLIALAGGLLIGGYMVGYSAFRNIWVVSVVSVTSILIVEPGLTYAVFRELPGRGAMLGLVFGALGFLATLFA